ncbi:MAG TPA: hypothetical protein VFQ45_21530 [Longimicrobium sp.]|nr:hypothetical protein [Longimicrobium sp.]
MQKLRLDLDALEVESFDTVAGASAARGTVKGHRTETEPIDYIDTAQFTCTTCPSAQSCPAVGCGGSAGCVTAYTDCGQDTCGNYTCGWTYCVNSCNWCDSFYTDKPELC